MFKKIIAIIIGITLMPMPVFAKEQGTSVPEMAPDATMGTDSTSGVDFGTTDEAFISGADTISSALDNVQVASLQNQNMSLSDALSKNFDIAFNTSPYFSLGQYHDVGLNMDNGLLNSQFEAMATAMLQENATSTQALGNSANAMAVFNASYGDLLDKLTIEEYQIPESFSPSDMLSSMQNSFFSQYGEATSTGSFADIKNSIDISDIFAKANQGFSSDIVSQLPSVGSLSSMLSGMSGDINTAMQSEYDSKLGDDGRPSFESGFYSSAMSDAMNAFDWSSSILGSDPSSFSAKTQDELVNDAYGHYNTNHSTSLNLWRNLKDVEKSRVSHAKDTCVFGDPNSDINEARRDAGKLMG